MKHKIGDTVHVDFTGVVQNVIESNVGNSYIIEYTVRGSLARREGVAQIPEGFITREQEEPREE